VLCDAAGARFAVALFARRSRLHPGTRYLARGLNDVAAPGNEVECEQLCWRVTEQADAEQAAASPAAAPTDAPSWASHVWRRGTVPIRWGAEIKNTVGEAEIYVAAREPYDGTGTYFARLATLYAPPPAEDAAAAAAAVPADADADAPAAVAVPAPVETVCADAPQPQPAPQQPPYPITCVNLLRSGLRAPELLLTEHFQEGARSARRRHPVALSSLRVLNFDWHANVKALGEAAAVEGLWAQLQGACACAGVTMGTTAPHGVAAWQRGLVRYNCADSLDRTNLASFFGALQVLLEQGKRLGLALELPQQQQQGGGAAGDAASLSGRRFGPGGQSLWAQPTGGAAAAAAVAAVLSPRGEAAVAAPPPLPAGWESRRDAVRCAAPHLCPSPLPVLTWHIAPALSRAFR
jgi:hypothetical protein